MDDLVELIGRNIDSAPARAVLSRYDLRAETQDLAPEEGVPPEHYLTSEDDGLQIRHSAAGAIEVMFLYGGGREGFSAFRGPLICRLSFRSDDGAIRAVLGEPDFSVPAGEDPILGSYGTCLRYDLERWSVHFQLRVDGRGIDLITVMAPDRVPSGRRGEVE